MNLYVLYLLAAFALGIALWVAVAAAGFRWGCFAALKARAGHAPKWEAYLLALLPPVSFALALLLDRSLAELALRVFATLVGPAFIGTCLNYNRTDPQAV